MAIGFFKVLGLISTLAGKVSEAAEDNKITITEAVGILEAVCLDLGIDFDTEGVDLGNFGEVLKLAQAEPTATGPQEGGIACG